MRSAVKGSRSSRTMRALVDRRRTRTPAGALLELSALASEKELLKREVERWNRRNVEIQTRLADIADKERRLMAVVGGSIPAPADVAAAKAVAAAAAAGSRIKVKEFSY
jgi:tRNA-dihydrouridine synthase